MCYHMVFSFCNHEIKNNSRKLLPPGFYNKTKFEFLPSPGCLIRHALINAASSLLTGSSLLSVVRVYCKICGHTHALLLSSMVPYSQIPLALHVRLIQLLQQNPEQFRLGRVERVKGTIVSKEYFFPKRFVTIRSRDIKRELTEEQRKEIAERLKKLS